MQKFTVTAPTRVDLSGGTLDIWPLYCIVGGAKTINLAIDHNASVEFEVNSCSRLKVELTAGGSQFQFDDLGKEESIPGILKLPTMIVKEYLRQKGAGVEIHLKISLRAEAPMQSGLGGSSAMCVALVRGLGIVFKNFLQMGWQWELLTWVKDAEAAFLKAPTGTQDYLASLFGGMSCFISRIGKIEYSPLPKDVVTEFSQRMIVLFSGETHHSGLSNWDLIKSAIDGDTVVIRGLSEIKELSDQLDDELRGYVSWKHVGQYLTDEWKIRKATLGVQTQRLEEILEFLASKAVLGAKVCGAASGGSILALVDPNRKGPLIDACKQFGIQVLSSQAALHPVTVQHY